MPELRKQECPLGFTCAALAPWILNSTLNSSTSSGADTFTGLLAWPKATAWLLHLSADAREHMQVTLKHLKQHITTFCQQTLVQQACASLIAATRQICLSLLARCSNGRRCSSG